MTSSNYERTMEDESVHPAEVIHETPNGSDSDYPHPARPRSKQATPREQDPLTPHYCAQCGCNMGFEWFLGPVCGKCCRANHRRVCGK